MTTETEASTTMRATKLLKEIGKAWLEGKRRVWMEGGTWSSKTFSAIQFLKMIAQKNSEPLLISVVSETVPHLKRGAIRDFITIMGAELHDKWWNRTDYIYRFPNGSTIEFFSADMPAKLRGGRRDVLFVNEANNISYDSFRELDMRTRVFTLADWNPVSEFWAHDSYFLHDVDNNLIEPHEPISPDEVYLHSVYGDAIDVIPQNIVYDLESYSDKDPNWYQVYVQGLLGKLTGLVYPNFQQVDAMPDYPRFYGLDFGCLADPTVLTEHCLVGDKLYSRELFYEYDAEMTNNKISMKMQLLKVSRTAPIYPDPDEPKSMVELRQLGWTIGETVKGKGSVEFGIKAVNNYHQHWTKDSLNCIKEQRNYRYVPDKNGNLTDNTTHRWSHGMKSREYAVASHNPQVSVRRSKRSNYW